MSAYIILRITVTDPDKLKAYQNIAPGIIERYNGKIRVRGGEVTSLEGPEENRRVVMIEFPNQEEAKAFYASDAYERVIEMRKGAAVFEAIAVDGVS